MMYRAKVTHIQIWIRGILPISKYSYCNDATDTYIEVADEKLADVIEQYNSKYDEIRMLRGYIMDVAMKDRQAHR